MSKSFRKTGNVRSEPVELSLHATTTLRQAQAERNFPYNTIVIKMIYEAVKAFTNRAMPLPSKIILTNLTKVT